MKTIDEMLINETGKSLEVISEEPELKENKEILLAARENIYANVNIIRNVLDDSKLEESEVMWRNISKFARCLWSTLADQRDTDRW